MNAQAWFCLLHLHTVLYFVSASDTCIAICALDFAEVPHARTTIQLIALLSPRCSSLYKNLRTSLNWLSFVQEDSPTYTHCWSWYHEHKLLHRLDKRRADSTEGNRHPEPHWRRPQDPQEAGSFPLLLDTSGSHRHPSQQRCRHGISTGRAVFS